MPHTIPPKHATHLAGRPPSLVCSLRPVAATPETAVVVSGEELPGGWACRKAFADRLNPLS